MTEVKENNAYVTAEYLKKRAQDVKQIKTRSYELMQIQPDSKILDVGCGPAIDTIPLSQYIGEGGRVVGVDNDLAMIEKANQEAKAHNITQRIQHIEANAHQLPFADGEFDRVHAERLFQVLPKADEAAVFGELNRVLRSGGRIVLVDTDWASASVNFSDPELERRLINFFGAKMRPNGFAGRELFGLIKDNGYTDLAVEVIPFITWDFSETPFCDWLPAEALKAGVATKEELKNWRGELTEKTAFGAYFSYVNIVIVAATKS